MSAVSLVQEKKLERAENALGRLARLRNISLSTWRIRTEQAIALTGDTRLLPPMLEELMQADEDMAKVQDDILWLYEQIGGKVRE
jgi:hypothetical protein